MKLPQLLESLSETTVSGLDIDKTNFCLSLSFCNGAVVRGWRYWWICDWDGVTVLSENNTYLMEELEVLRRLLLGKKVVLASIGNCCLGIDLEENLYVEFYPYKELRNRYRNIPNWEIAWPERKLSYLMSSREKLVRSEGKGYDKLCRRLKRKTLPRRNYPKQYLPSFDADLRNILNTEVLYSRCGGGAGSILLLNFSDDSSLWCWRYWEISRYNELLANSEDDATAIVGKMARTARLIEGKKVLGVCCYGDMTLNLLFEDFLELSVFPEKEKSRKKIKRALCNWEFFSGQSGLCYTLTSILSLKYNKYE